MGSKGHIYDPIQMHKTVIQVWVTKCATEFPPDTEKWNNQAGLGDLVRGAIGLYKLCKQKGYEFIVDISLHPLAQYLHSEPHRFSQLVHDNKDTITGVFHEHLSSFLETALEHQDYVMCHSISWPTTYDEPASVELKEFIKTVLMPGPTIATYLAEVQHSLPLAYRIVHFRVGDDDLVDGKTPDSYDAFLNLYEPSAEPTLILSDSQTLKQLLKSKYDVHILTHNIAHVGKHTDIDAIRNTLAEFFLSTKATSIQSFTVYWWSSGFMKIANYIYDVPLHSITDVK